MVTFKTSVFTQETLMVTRKAFVIEIKKKLGAKLHLNNSQDNAILVRENVTFLRGTQYFHERTQSFLEESNTVGQIGP